MSRELDQQPLYKTSTTFNFKASNWQIFQEFLLQAAPNAKSRTFNSSVGIGGGIYLCSQMLSHDVIFG